MVSRSSLSALSCFVERPTNEHASSLVVIPALYSVLQLEGKGAQTYPSDLLGMCRWLAQRTNEVLTTLSIHSTPDTDENIDANMDWRQVSCNNHTIQLINLPATPDWLLLQYAADSAQAKVPKAER